MRVLKNRHFWFITALFIILAIIHYAEQIGLPGTQAPSQHWGLQRHSVDRIFLFMLVVYAGFVFDLYGALIAGVVAVLIMLPRAIFFSPDPADAVLESLGAVMVSAIAVAWIWSRTKAKNSCEVSLAELNVARKMLQEVVRSLNESERQQATLYAISSTLSESLNLESVLQKAIAMVSELMQSEVTLIFSLEEETRELRVVAHEGVSDEFVRAVDGIKVGEGFYGKVAEAGEAMVVEDTSLDPRLNSPDFKSMQIQAQLIVPLIYQDETRGIICVAMRRPRHFSHDDVELLGIVARQIATAVENARLYEKEHLTARRLAVSERNYRELFENARDAIWTHDVYGNITAANKAMEELTGYSTTELSGMNVRDFLSTRSVATSNLINLWGQNNESSEQPYEQSFIRKDGVEAVLMVTSNPITEDGKPIGFQQIARDVTRERWLQDNLRYYVEHITDAQEEERKRIARELHDDTAQALYAILRQVDNFIRGSDNLSEENKVFFGDLRGGVSKVLQGVRRFSQDLRPSILDDLGLVAAIRWLASELKERCNIEALLKVQGVEQRLPPHTELLLFRIVQEALRNVEKHAQASKVTVEMLYSENRIKVIIIDNGKGFRLSGDLADLPRQGRLGLAGMEERARLVGGSLSIETEPGKGTTVTVDVPVSITCIINSDYDLL